MSKATIFLLPSFVLCKILEQSRSRNSLETLKAIHSDSKSIKEYFINSVEALHYFGCESKLKWIVMQNAVLADNKELFVTVLNQDALEIQEYSITAQFLNLTYSSVFYIKILLEHYKKYAFNSEGYTLWKLFVIRKNVLKLVHQVFLICKKLMN